ncbi:unnamed protein product [Haemonchus placei]|uniref:DUF4303 domain-containing protein n=1 Tax=Haemonchus placei TaxID=6290 RepID=A0A0N4W2Y4_HAEPC|nr:unnamed protein product [Haemonchus placei]
MELDFEVLRSTVEEDPYLTTIVMATMLGYHQSTIVCGVDQLGKPSPLFFRPLAVQTPAALSGREKFETEDDVRKVLDDFFKSQPSSFWEEIIDKPERFGTE